METVYCIPVVATILVAVAVTAKNIIGHRRVMRQRKRFHAYVRGVYESRGCELPTWAQVKTLLYSHYHAVRAFFRACGADLDTPKLTEHLDNYVLQLSALGARSGLTPRSHSKYVVDPHSFLRYCDHRDWPGLDIKKALVTLRALPTHIARAAL